MFPLHLSVIVVLSANFESLPLASSGNNLSLVIRELYCVHGCVDLSCLMISPPSATRVRVRVR